MTGPGLLTPREWLEGWPFPWPAVQSRAEGEPLRACFCVSSVQLGRTRSDEPYLRLSLADRHGAVEARLWENAEQVAAVLHPGVYVGVEGRLEHHNGQPQLCLEAVAPLRVALADLELFLPRSERPAEVMAAELDALVQSVADAGLRQLLDTLLGADSDIGQGFRLAPAAKFNHHAFLGGLLEHTLSVATVCDLLASHYGSAIDRDLLVAAALLHDVGKVREIGARAGFPYTDEGKLLGHILLGLQMVSDAARAVPELAPRRLLLLQHLIASHQGRYEWQSPREPALLEGLLLHYADDLDAKLQQINQLLARAEGPWTGYDRNFRREFLRHLPAAPAPFGQPEPAAAAAHAEPLAPLQQNPVSSPQPVAPPSADQEEREPPAVGLCRDTLDLFADTEEG